MRTKSTKLTKELIIDICSLVEKDTYSIAEICQMVGISERSYYSYQKNNTEFAAAIKKAELMRRQSFAIAAKKSLLKKIEGYSVEEIKEIYGTPKTDKCEPPLKERTVITKHFQPDTAAIIFTLCNTEPDKWRNRIAEPRDIDQPNDKPALMKLPDGTTLEL